MRAPAVTGRRGHVAMMMMRPGEQPVQRLVKFFYSKRFESLLMKSFSYYEKSVLISRWTLQDETS